MIEFNPGLIMILGGLLVPLIPRAGRRALLLALPVAGLAYTTVLDPETLVTSTFFSYTLEVSRVDKLALVWGYIFHIAAFLGGLYSLHEDDTLQSSMSQIYMGSAVAAVFAGDLITLFVFWELTAISSVFLIWATGTERSFRAGMRYLIIQVGSGVLLLAGAILILADTGSIAFDHIGIESLGGKIIFVAFGIKCAFPLLHNWLQDSYPESTVTGTVILSAFTTKLAVYSLTRGFSGTEILIYIGAIMTAFPIFYAVIENDLRRVLAYSLNNQLGFMVVGVGVGTELSLNGTAAHAFSHILYKALLFMSMGAVLYRTGTIKGSELGGLYKTMPWTTGFCIVGAASISAFPLFSGFISKSLILTALGIEGHWFIWAVLLFASARIAGIIWACIPLALIGVSYGLLITGAPFGFMALLGFLSLSGMIIKNGIVLVEQVKLELEEGKAPYSALFHATLSRVRPVCMAAITTILGMIPLLFDDFFASMAVVIMFGLGFATLLTLVFVPVLYSLVFKIQK